MHLMAAIARKGDSGGNGNESDEDDINQENQLVLPSAEGDAHTEKV